MLNQFKKVNLYLVIGIILTSSLLIIAIFGAQLAPHDINHPVNTKIDEETNEFTTAPFSPSSEHWLGTDVIGTDILSMLLYGAKYTLLVVVIVSSSRLLIGIPLGLIVGWWSDIFRAPLTYINRAWSSLPLFLFVLAIIGPVVFFSDDQGFQIFMTWLVLTVAGLPPIIDSVRNHVETVKKYDFMEGVKVLGGHPFYILRKHILPHVKPYLAIIFAMDMAQLLWLLGQLGIFYVFVGGTIVSYDDMTGITNYFSVSGEWAGLLGGGRRYFRIAPWIFFSPALAFAYGVLAFQFLAEGLRRSLNKNTMLYDYN